MPKKHPTPAHLRDRIAVLRKRLRDADVDALLVTNPRDIRYLTCFVGDDSWALISQRSSQATILSDFRFDEQIAREAPHAKVILRKKSLTDELAALLDRTKADRIGLQPGHVTLAMRKAIVKKLGAKRVVAFDDKLLEQRAVKSADEVKAIRKALRIQQQAFRETCAFMEPGQSEQEVAAYLEYRMRVLGADGVSFPTIVAADANASLPHAVPGSKKLRRNGTVLIDWGAKWNGYCSDLTRVVALERMSAKVQAIYQIVLDAQLAAIDAIAPGKPLKAIDAVARKVITDAGYGDRFGHSLGHGIGLDIHEQPTLSPRSEGVLEPGQVVTVEPGIYLPGVGGVRIEDDVLVTARGATVLSDLPKSLESAII
ncbi:MAG: aminopeptidase P family protein [Phycisphaeraceae bacterium]